MTKQEFFSRDNSYFFFDDPKATADYCWKHWPEECEHMIRVADECCRNFFLFDLKWDLERTWEGVDFGEGDVDWDYNPGNDPEFSFQFNRHRYFICMGQAYWLTGEEKYAEHFARLLGSWLKNVPHTLETEKTTWRVLEAGFRGEFWVKAIRYFKDSAWVTDELVDAFYQCLVEHGNYIIKMHSPYRYISNWGVIENHGLFEIGIALPDGEVRDKFIQTALEHLEVTARMQIFADGVQWEQACAYHNEVLHCYEDVMILAMRNHIDLPESFVQAVHKMALTDVAWKKPNHHQLIMGDSDDTDLRDYISVAAWIFKDPVLKGAGYPLLDFESVWDLGMESAKEYETLESREPEFTSIALADSGNYYLRSGWDEKANLLHFHCGTMGAGHGHSDKLHVDLVICGEDVLTDAGRYNYMPGPGRYDFKNPPAHNTITVDNAFFTVCKDSWECSKLCQPVKQPAKLLKDYEFIQGGHLGYMDREQGVFVNRMIVHIMPDLFVVMDELYGGDRHSYQQYWNFSEWGKVVLGEKMTVEEPELAGLNPAGSPDPTLHKDWTAKAPSFDHLATGPVQTAVFTGKEAEARFFFVTPGTEVSLGKSKISRHYNFFEERDAVTVTQEKKGFASFLTVIQGGEKGTLLPCKVERFPVKSALKGVFHPFAFAEGVKISVGEREYVLIICHQEVNTPTDLEEVDGCLGYGNVVVFDKTKEDKVGTVLNY